MITGLLLHSVSYSGSWGQPTLSLEAFLDHAAGLGFDGVMLMAKRPHLSVLDYDDDACLRLRDHIERRGLRKVVIAGYTNLTASFSHPDIPQVEYQLAHISRLAQIARLLGVRRRLEICYGPCATLTLVPDLQKTTAEISIPLVAVTDEK